MNMAIKHSAGRRRPPPFHTRKRWQGSLETVTRRLYLRRKRMRQLVRQWSGHQPEKVVVFLAGVHRSGTNMMMETLEWHPDTDVFRESDPRAFKHFMMRPDAIIAGLIRSSPASRVVIKALHETERLSQLMEHYQPARLIWMYRDWRDVVNSILSRWPGQRNGVDQIVAGTGTADWRGRGMSEATRAELQRRYRPDLSDASVNVLFWYFRNQLFFEQTFDTDRRVALISYDRLLENPRPQLRALSEFLQMEYDPRMAQVSDAGRIRKKPPPDVDPQVAALGDRMLNRLNAAWLASPFGRTS